MNYSIGVEHALHSLFYMIDLKQTQTIGIKALSNLHGVSESYLSKIFTKLKKGGIVISMPGVNGGYKHKLMSTPCLIDHLMLSLLFSIT